MNDQAVETATLRAEINLDGHEIAQRKAWLRLGDEDAIWLRHIADLVEPYVDTIVETVAQQMRINGEDPSPEDEPSRKLLRDYFSGLSDSGGFDESFIDRRLTMVRALQRRVFPDVSWYLAAYLSYLQAVATILREQTGDLNEMQRAYRTLAKVVFLDLSLAVDTLIVERNRTIRSQQHELEKLSTPVLQLRDGLLILPIVGMLDSHRAQQLTEQLLQAIRRRRGKVVVLDVTGVAAVDSRVANHLIQTVDAARLMGAKAIITGVSPEVAQTLVGLGISLGNVTTLAELQDGVDEADRELGLRVLPAEEAQDEGGPA